MSDSDVRVPATRADLFQLFTALGIVSETFEHQAVFTVEEARAVHALVPGLHCKNLFLKDAKGTLWLVVAPAEATIDLKTLHTRIGAKRLSFGSAALLFEVLGVEAGSVTPFALINDRDQRVKVVLDQGMMAAPLLNFHPLANTASSTITPADLIRFVESCGHVPRVIAVTTAS